MVRFYLYFAVCFGLVLISSTFNTSAVAAITLPMPEPEALGAMIKNELMEYLEILISNVVPAVGFSLVIRKITS